MTGAASRRSNRFSFEAGVMSKNIFAQSTGLQLSNSAQSQIASKPQRSEAVTFELNGDGARLDLAAVVQGAPLEALASVTEAQPAPSDADRILPSAAAFRDASVDPLHNGSVPLALLGQEAKKRESLRQRQSAPDASSECCSGDADRHGTARGGAGDHGI
jgi:hypothetical protein